MQRLIQLFIGFFFSDFFFSPENQVLFFYVFVVFKRNLYRFYIDISCKSFSEKKKSLVNCCLIWDKGQFIFNLKAIFFEACPVKMWTECEGSRKFALAHLHSPMGVEEYQHQCQKMYLSTCAQQRFRSACAFAESDQTLPLTCCG